MGQNVATVCLLERLGMSGILVAALTRLHNFANHLCNEENRNDWKRNRQPKEKPEHCLVALEEAALPRNEYDHGHGDPLQRRTNASQDPDK